MIGRPIIRLDSVSSTQDLAFRLAELGAIEGTTVVARHQTGGRGRAGRHWTAPPGEALLFSVLFRPHLSQARLSPLSILIADAIATTLELQFGLHPAIKWPNDVLVNGRKLSGILIQARRGIAVAKQVQPDPGDPIEPDALLRSLLHAIGERYEALLRGDIEGAMRRVNDRLHLRGEHVTLQDGDRIIGGRVQGVRDDGALLLEVGNEVRAVVSGELVRGPRPALP